MSENRLYSIDYLRMTSILLILFNHSLLPYATLAHISSENYVFSTWPVIEAGQQSNLVSILSMFMETFNMPMLLCIAGFFSAITVNKAGWLYFMKGRFIRVGLPFLILITVYTPLGAYASYRLAGNTENYLYFWRNEFFSNHWYAMPNWFFWVLLAFSAIYALIRIHKINRYIEGIHFTPSWVAKMLLVSFFSYVILLGMPHYITHLYGPFWVQQNRFLLYLLFYLIGALLGATWYKQPTLISKDSILTRLWWVYVGLSAILYSGLFYALYHWANFDGEVINTIQNAQNAKDIMPHLSTVKAFLVYSLLFPILCLFMIIGLLGLYCRHLNYSSRMLIYISQHSYGMILVHFPIVVWLQYALFEVDLSIPAKIGIIFSLTFMFSLMLAIGLKKMPGVRRIV